MEEFWKPLSTTFDSSRFQFLDGKSAHELKRTMKVHLTYQAAAVVKILSACQSQICILLALQTPDSITN